MRYLPVIALCMAATGVGAEQAPELSPEAELLNSSTCLVPDIAEVLVYCEVFEETIGGDLYFWERVRLKSTHRIIRVSWWKQFGHQEILFEAEGFFGI